MASYSGSLFYAHDVKPEVYEADVPGLTVDAEGKDIRVLSQSAFSYMPNPGRFGVYRGGEGVSKRVNGITPQIVGTEETDLQLACLSDFSEVSPKTLWSRVRVGKGLAVRRRVAVNAAGNALSPVLRSAPDPSPDSYNRGNSPVRLYNLSLEYTVGGRLR